MGRVNVLQHCAGIHTNNLFSNNKQAAIHKLLHTSCWNADAYTVQGRLSWVCLSIINKGIGSFSQVTGAGDMPYPPAHSVGPTGREQHNQTLGRLAVHAS